MGFMENKVRYGKGSTGIFRGIYRREKKLFVILFSMFILEARDDFL